jgi:hypothetical protein
MARITVKSACLAVGISILVCIALWTILLELPHVRLAHWVLVAALACSAAASFFKKRRVLLLGLTATLLISIPVFACWRRFIPHDIIGCRPTRVQVFRPRQPLAEDELLADISDPALLAEMESYFRAARTRTAVKSPNRDYLVRLWCPRGSQEFLTHRESFRLRLPASQIQDMHFPNRPNLGGFLDRLVHESVEPASHE